jgi:hypothetical protein
MLRHRVSRISIALIVFSLVSACATPSNPYSPAARRAASEKAADFRGFMDAQIRFDHNETAKSFGATRANALTYTTDKWKPGDNPGKAVLGAFKNWCRNTGGTESPLNQVVKSLRDGIGEVCAYGTGQTTTQVAVLTYNDEDSRRCHVATADESKQCKSTILYVDAPDFPEFTATIGAKIEKNNAERAERQAHEREEAQRRWVEEREAAKRHAHEQKIREEKARAEAAARNRAFAEWRTRAKVGDSCWVGPYPKGEPPFDTNFFQHGLIVEVRRPLVRIQFDGGTSARFSIGLTAVSKEKWIPLDDVFPESAYTLACSPCGNIWVPRD